MSKLLQYDGWLFSPSSIASLDFQGASANQMLFVYHERTIAIC